MMLATNHVHLPQGKGINNFLKFQQVFTFNGLPGFIQTKVEVERKKVSLDNYVMIGYPNGGGVWTEF